MQKTNRLKGLSNILTMKVVQRGLMRNPDQIFNELTQLNREKTRLYQEKIFWQEKIDLIEARLLQIEQIMKSLQEQMEGQEKSLQQQMEPGALPKERDLKVQDAKQTAGDVQDAGQEEIRNEIVIRY